MTRRLTRRGALGAAAAAGALALGGCLDGGRRRGGEFWDDPPSIDTAGVSRAIETPVPDRPRLVPVPIESEAATAFADRVDRLLEPVPDPLTAETLPNGAIREQIAAGRDDARDALPAPEASLTPLRRAERFATARAHAATAVGTWAAVTTEGDPEGVTAGLGTVRHRTAETLAALPGTASDPLAGAAVYGPIERWLDTARRRDLVGGEGEIAASANPLRAGETVGEVERVQSHVEVGRHLRRRYEGSLSEPRAVDTPLREAAEAVGAAIGDRLRALHGEEAERLRRSPGIEAFLDDRPVPRDAPSVSLLSGAVYRTFDELWFDPIPIDDWTPDHPATSLTRTALARVRLRALDALAARIEDGETMFPSDPAAVADARDDAIGSMEGLVTSANPLARWLGAQVRPLFDEHDAVLSGTTPGARPVAEAFAGYRWIGLVADEVDPVLASVNDAVESAD
ncbi:MULTISPECIES: hypothetical protein [unclassified Halorubrum]|uniref:hypothetical protein n=1 Tax=unclassified Halorubrum TaxID=2642239 RepID=UPI000B981D9A|nr:MULTISPECIES: hypothetical protein [unclassified Halorubrum]OYR45373.1 hypothetical protein DJ75_07940 [Halorubrum sp. Eb13]OYR50238.1 hypothetical protein DJ73_16285 [Halorubrum sp. Ea1]